MNIQNILFDFGGVIIDIDFEKTIQAFVRLGAGSFPTQYSKARQSGIFDQLDKGSISERDFIHDMKQLLPDNITDDHIIEAWNEIIIGIPPRRIEMLESVRNNYSTLLLSNTNIIHYKFYTPQLEESFGYKSLEELFDAVYLSFRLGMRKPDRDIFDYVFATRRISKESTLFIDDSEHIVQAAKDYGIRAFWLRDGMDVCDLFENGYLKASVIGQL